MSESSEKVKRWRKNSKNRIVEAMGGECVICGYNKCTTALALHHLDPSKKEIGFGAIRANPQSWNKIVEELRKCILVCSNCHAEIHEGITEIPKNVKMFNEEFSQYRVIKKDTYHSCPVCGNKTNIINKYCSLNCAGKSSWRVDWNKIDLQKELQTKSIVKLSEELGCSDGAIHKRLRKLGLK